MRNQLKACFLAVLLTAVPAFAQFEGVLEMKLTMTAKDNSERGGGTMNLALAKAGLRSELNLQMGPAMAMKMVMLQRTDTPSLTYRIDDANKTYTEIQQAKPADANSPAKDKWSVEKLGQEKILDYNTQHVLAKPKNGAGQPMELWLAKDFLDYDTYSKLQANSRMRGEEGLAQALKEAGVEGMPLKAVVSNDDGGKATMEVVKAEKKALPASTFEIPAGYTKSEGGMMDMMGGLSGAQADAMKVRMEEARKKMAEQMKNLPAEQRDMLEKMMKQRPGGSQ